MPVYEHPKDNYLILAALAYLNPSIYKTFINEVFCNIETVVLGSGAGSAIYTKDS
ncbi:hypothetical protein ACI3LX_003439 [Candidozyma auris]